LLLGCTTASALDQDDFPQLFDYFARWIRGRRLFGSFSIVEFHPFFDSNNDLPVLVIVGDWEPHTIA